MRRIAISVMTIAVIAACKTSGNVVRKSTTDSKVKKEQRDTCRTLMLDSERTADTSDPFQLLDARINGKNLEIDVQYGGGCGGAEFDLVWNGALMKSMPPKANLTLLLKDNDMCKALVTKTLCFDISSVYKGECVIFLKGFEGKLVYK